MFCEGGGGMVGRETVGGGGGAASGAHSGGTVGTEPTKERVRPLGRAELLQERYAHRGQKRLGD
jgi:hypothetical protein